MKIACDACEAKYSIADDKVRGKVFKIRCKKCSNVIVVRGVGEVAPEPVVPPVEEEGRVWYLVIREDQVGPFTVDEVRLRFASGEIDGDTYAWREGQPDWVPLAEIAELAPSDAPPETLADAPLPPPSVVDDNVQRLRGERNESSVLFSLNNLAQIATRAPSRAAAASGGLETHTPGQEGSGLIDIRSMASAYLGAGTATAKPAASIGSIDDLPVFNTGSAFSEPAVLVPSIAHAAPSKLMYVMIAAIVAFATVAIILLVMLLRHHDPAIVAVAEPPPAPPPPHEVAPPPVPPVPVAIPTPPEAPPAPPPAPKAHKLATPPAPPAAPKQVKQAKQEAPTDCDDIFCAINGDAPCCQKQHAKAAPPPPPPPTKNLPDQLTVGMITTAMDAVRGKAMACSTKSTAKGRVKVHLKVAGDGHVASVTVEASPDDTLGACVKATVSRATFPQTNTGGSFSVPYTF